MKQGWSFLNLWRKPLSLSVKCWRGGVYPSRVTRKGKASPLEAGRGSGPHILDLFEFTPQSYGGANWLGSLLLSLPLILYD